MKYLALDPGPIETAYALIDSERRPIEFGKVPNAEMRARLPVLVDTADRCAVEMIASYGMPVGAEVFETCVEIGRFMEIAARPLRRIFRGDVKLHLCHDKRAKDANVTRALVDRFACGQANYGKGTKVAPGWFHGFRADIWAAYAVAVYLADISESRGAPA